MRFGPIALLLVACTQSKRDRCIETENHVADVVVEHWTAHPEEWCQHQVKFLYPDGPPDSSMFFKCRIKMMTPEGRAALDEFAHIGTAPDDIDYCVKTASDTFLECRRRATTYDEVGACYPKGFGRRP